MSAQLDLFIPLAAPHLEASPDKPRVWVRSPHSHVERSGTAVYSHLVRAKDDPPESRARGKDSDTKAWKRVMSDRAEWTRRIREHMADGKPRTFNRIVVELCGFTANVAFEKAPDHALWDLVEDGELAHTLDVPVLFSAIEQATEVAAFAVAGETEK